ncbi:MAG: CHASE2 domain-containing protein [Candidatus Rokubacteria bacterium]|nr:CHASE2 domain-containing protein [Candidatus Rokubacteria bacterium]
MKFFPGAARPWLIGVGVGTAVALTTLPGAFEFLELRSLDLRFLLRGPIPPDSPIVIISIDEDSFDELDLAWPWPRELHARMLDIVRQGRPAAIGMDLLFVEPSIRGPRDDQALAGAVARAGNVVLGAVLTEIREALFVKEDLNPPLKVIRDRAAAFGFVNLVTDEDAFVRSGALTRPYQGGIQQSFDGHLYDLAVKAGIRAKPLPPRPAVFINYRGPKGTFPVIPYYQVLNGEVKPETFAGKIVLVGATAPALHDEFPTPFSGQEKMPGVEIHANVVETLLQGNGLFRVPLSVGAVLALVAALLAALVTSLMRPIRAFLLTLAAGVSYAVLAFGVFVRLSLWMELIPVQVALFLGFGTTVVVNFIQEQREKRRLSRFFSPDVIKEILSTRKESSLVGSRRRISVLFSDIRGFTSLSEKLSPEEVVEMLREYLTAMTEIVFKYGGTVDKYIGDAIMALYGAPFDQPNHAEQAVRTALEFQDRVKALSDRWEARCGARLRNGVGINTGDAVVGTIGSLQRLEYTAIGDTVNLASRLEGLTKEFLAPIVVSQSTYEEVKHLFYSRYLGEVKVRGKETAVKIYAVEKAEGRQAPRASFEAPVTIVDEDISITAAMTDLSRTGMAARNLPKRIPANRIVAIRIDVPGLREPLAVDGRVIWTDEDRAGFAFVGLSLEDENLLEDFVKRRNTRGES